MARKNDRGGATPFTQEDFKYSLDEFLSFGHDDHGQSVRTVNRITPQMERDIEVVMQGRRFPYKTSGDLVRHAIIRHLEWLHRIEPDMPRHFLAAIQAVGEIVRDMEMLTTMQQTFARLDSLIESLTASGDNAEAMRVLSQAKGQLSKVPDSRWKREFTERFLRKYSRPSPSSMPTVVEDAQSGRLLEFPALSPSSPPYDRGEGPGEQDDEPQDADGE